MTLFDTFSILIVLSAIFIYINHRFIKFPSEIGLMLIALVTSLALASSAKLFPNLLNDASKLLNSFDFSKLLMGYMLSFMLFAGALHLDLEELKKEKLAVILYSTFSVIISTFIIGTVVYYLLPLFSIHFSFIYCLFFGALISPTDPIAVLAIIKQSGISKGLEVKIAGESLFNDGVAVVIFLTILKVANYHDSLNIQDISIIFFREAIGGIVFGFALGYAGYWLMKSVDNYKVEVMLTLAVVMGGYALADWIGVSGPLSMVVAGIMIGNYGKRYAMSVITTEYVFKFWELINEILNAVLFVLIGLEFVVIHFTPYYFIIGLILIIILLFTRYISLWIPSLLIRLHEDIDRRTLMIMTWGGLRGGICIALALSLKPEFGKEFWVAMTYLIVAFSILFQGLTISRFAKITRP